MHLFELRPNSSLTPRAATLFYLSIVAVAMTVATACAVLGYWPILPFAGLELAGLGAALAVSLRRSQAREYIRVDEQWVVVEQAARGRRVEYTFARPWTRIELQRSVVANWPSRLFVRSRGRRVEIGAFLTEGERCRLENRLAAVMATRVAGDPGGVRGADIGGAVINRAVNNKQWPYLS